MATESNNQNLLLKIFSIILALSIAMNIILFLKRSEVFPGKKDLITENRQLIREVNQFKSELNKYKGISSRIDQVIQDGNLKLEDKEKQITRLRKEKDIQEKNNLLLIQEADSIKELYINMIDSLLIEREAKKVINNRIEALEDIISGLNTKLGYAAMLNADNLKVSPMKVGGGGKKQPTAIAKKVNGIQITFEILPNRVSTPGLKNIYVVFTSPDAKVLFDQRNGAIEFHNPDFKKDAQCSISDAFNYKNEKISLSFQFQPETELRPGLYIAEVFTSENKLGMTTFSLR